MRYAYRACLDGGPVKIAWLELLPAWVLFGWRPEKFSWCDLHALLPARQADEIGPLAPPASCLAIITVQTPTSSLLLNYFTQLPCCHFPSLLLLTLLTFFLPFVLSRVET
jgi:hypothetical protein